MLRRSRGRSTSQTEVALDAAPDKLRLPLVPFVVFLAPAAVVMLLWGADAAGTPLDEMTPPARLAILVGNEGAGLTPEGLARVARRVALPISSAVESLNVAVATGILLYQLRT
jgi:hypothetical protein